MHLNTTGVARTVGLAGVAIALLSVPGSAHHSFATFDTDREVVLEGTVKDFQWTNPHAWIILAVAKDEGMQRWAVELPGPSSLARQGWEPKTLAQGMPVTVIVHPLRDGTNGGQLVEVTLANGTVMGRPGPPTQ